MNAIALRPDVASLAAFWDAIAQYDGEAVWEVRGPKTKRKGPRRFFGTLSGCFTDRAAFVAAVQSITGEDVEALYLTLNPAHPALLARSANRIKDQARETTADADILRRTALLIDCDPVRPSGTSSTDAERDGALALRDTILAFLTDQAGFTEPLAITMSGNGAGLLFRVDLPNDDDATRLVKNVLAALGRLFDTPTVTVDVANFNAGRISKILGTVAAKGDNLPERPWRLATGTVNPEALAVPREALERAAAIAPKPEHHEIRAGRDGTGEPRWDLRALLTRAEIRWHEKARAGYTVFELDRCLTSPDHADGAALLEFPSGAVAYRCLHNRCTRKSWADLRSILAPEADAGRGKKGKGKRGDDKPKAPLPPELVGRWLHPALHFEADGLATVGIVTVGPDGKAVTEIVTSTRQRFPTEAIGAALTAAPPAYPDLLGRWRPEDVTRFLAGEDEPPTFESAIARTWERLDGLLELGRDCETVTLATWAVATYFHQVFLAFPRLDLRGERGSGKSKALSILAAVSFNGLLRVSPTLAVLFRLAESLRPTLCLDEIEGLAGDEKREILAILNSGYKAGGRVDRCEGDDHTLKSYSIYTPVALAGIQGLNRVTEDRAITLVLARGKDPARLNADVDPADPRFVEIRDLCYRLALLRWREVAETYRTLALPDWLVGRERELWRPLLVVAKLADSEAGDLNLVSDLLSLAREQGQERAGLSDEAEALVSVLAEKLAGAGEIIVHPGDLCDDLKTVLRWKDPPRPETVGRWLKRLKIPRAPRAAGGVRYIVTEAGLDDIRARAGSGEGEPTLPAILHTITP